MPTLEEVQKQIGLIDGSGPIMGRKEIKELPSILWHDEKIEKVVQGFYNNGTGILVATDRRLIFVDKGMLYGLKVEDFPYDKISSIQYETGMILGKITIFTSGNKATIDNVQKQQARDFGEYVRASITKIRENQISTPASNPQPMPAPNSQSFDYISQLERLAKLKEQGILTDDELATQKQRILSML